MPKQIMYSLRIEKKIINKAKKEAKKLSISTSAFIRQAIVEKVDSNRLNKIEKRLNKLEKTKY